MKQNIKKVSDNSLMEFRGLLNRIECLIDKDYCHVSELLPQSFLKALQTEINKVESEIESREL